MRRFQQQVVVVGHQAIPVDTPAVSYFGSPKCLEEHATIGVLVEDGAAIVASHGHVVPGACELDAMTAPHSIDDTADARRVSSRACHDCATGVQT
jgi:hypothetical protein